MYKYNIYDSLLLYIYNNNIEYLQINLNMEKYTCQEYIIFVKPAKKHIVNNFDKLSLMRVTTFFTISKSFDTIIIVNDI